MSVCNLMALRDKTMDDKLVNIPIMITKYPFCQRERGQWTVYHTGPIAFIIAFSYSLAKVLWGLW